MLRRFVSLLLALAVFSGCGSDDEPDARSGQPTTTSLSPAPTTSTVPPNVNTVALAVGRSVAVYEFPRQASPFETLENPTRSAAIGATTQLRLLVRERQGEWLNVLLPIRPNGTTGWIRQSDVRLDTNDFRILADLQARKLTVWKGGEVFMEEPIGVGKAATRTPGGLFYTTELLRPVGQPQYGPYAFALSGYSEVFSTFAGGPGQLGLHGTNNPSSVGAEASNGCIRMRNDAITRLAETLPLGVPVEIRG